EWQYSGDAEKPKQSRSFTSSSMRKTVCKCLVLEFLQIAVIKADTSDPDDTEEYHNETGLHQDYHIGLMLYESFRGRQDERLQRLQNQHFQHAVFVSSYASEDLSGRDSYPDRIIHILLVLVVARLLTAQSPDQNGVEVQVNNAFGQASKQSGIQPPFCFEDKCTCAGTVANCARNHGKLTFVPKFHENITFLDFSYNNLRYIPADFFVNVTSLTGVDLSSNELRHISEDAFRGLPHINKIILNQNYNLTFDLLEPVFKVTSLRHIDVHGCALGPIPDDLFYRFPLTNLTELYLGHNILRRLNFTVFKPLVKLESLRLDSNRISDNFVQTVLGTAAFRKHDNSHLSTTVRGRNPPPGEFNKENTFVIGRTGPARSVCSEPGKKNGSVMAQLESEVSALSAPTASNMTRLAIIRSVPLNYGTQEGVGVLIRGSCDAESSSSDKLQHHPQKIESLLDAQCSHGRVTDGSSAEVTHATVDMNPAAPRVLHRRKWRHLE
ncbi:hypothetical protein BaRGS_00029044, partial [Batillaria attramentaria]